MYMNRHAVVVVAASIGSILSPGLVLHGLEKETLSIPKCQIYALLANLYVYCVCVCVFLVLLCNRHLICKPVLPNPLHLPVIISDPYLSKEKIP